MRKGPGQLSHEALELWGLAAVAAGSAPGEPSGRWVAGCCASGADCSHGKDRVDLLAPLPASAHRPAHGVGGPQKRLVAGGAMIESRTQDPVDAGQGVGDDGAVPIPLHRGLGHRGARSSPQRPRVEGIDGRRLLLQAATGLVVASPAVSDGHRRCLHTRVSGEWLLGWTWSVLYCVWVRWFRNSDNWGPWRRRWRRCQRCRMGLKWELSGNGRTIQERRR